LIEKIDDGIKFQKLLFAQLDGFDWIG